MVLAFLAGSMLTLAGILFVMEHAVNGAVGALDFFRVLTVIEHKYVDRPELEKLWQGSIKGMVEALDDPHSIYMDAEQFDIFEGATSGSFGGVGLVVGEKDDELVVVSPIEGTPGEKAGVKSGDVILKIDEEDATNLNLTEAVEKIRGEEGTSVTLTIRRGEETKAFTIVRDNIQVHAVSGKMLEGDIGYLRITNFNEVVADDLKKEYSRLEKEGMKRIILDLRDNPGGLLDQSVEVSELFVPKGPVVSIVERDGSRTTYESHSEGSPYPVVVLVNQGSASASEIVAGAIQDTKSGTLIGTKTFGKGSVQGVFPLHSGAIKLTIAKYYTPNETLIDGVGITPDIVVEADSGSTRDNVLQTAIAHLKKK
ncbi:MAG: S41 family peptidase [Selenomonadales bacterium]|jgi:carboxyl-terminal processing protease|nr:S41 family peptidase [Selenomonadales bacterium]